MRPAAVARLLENAKTNRKENEHVENLLGQPCDLVFRTAVLRCCSHIEYLV